MVAKSLLSRITIDPAIFGGKPIIRGHRLAVEHVLGMLAAGDRIETILEGYEWLEREDVLACLEYARIVIGRDRGQFLSSSRAEPRQSSEVMTPEQKAGILEMLKAIENFPRTPEPDDGLVASRDHDQILYVRSPKAAFDENQS